MYSIANDYTSENLKDAVLYHYTSYEALLSILDKQELWFSDLNYQNNSAEFTWALTKIREYFLDVYGDGGLREIDSFLKVPPIYTFFLSKQKWGGDCPKNGCSITFNQEQLVDLVKREGLYMGECVYHEEEINQFIKQFIATPDLRRWRQINKTPESYRREIDTYFQNIIPLIYQYAPFIKHSKFSEEQEVRIVIIMPEWVPGKKVRKLDFRTANGSVIPFIKLKLWERIEDIKLEEIVIGPPQDSLKKAAIEMMLKDKCKNIKLLEVPYTTR